MGGIQLVDHISKGTFHRAMITWVYFIPNIIAPHRWMIFDYVHHIPDKTMVVGTIACLR